MIKTVLHSYKNVHFFGNVFVNLFSWNTTFFKDQIKSRVCTSRWIFFSQWLTCSRQTDRQTAVKDVVRFLWKETSQNQKQKTAPCSYPSLSTLSILSALEMWSSIKKPLMLCSIHMSDFTHGQSKNGYDIALFELWLVDFQAQQPTSEC